MRGRDGERMGRWEDGRMGGHDVEGRHDGKKALIEYMGVFLVGFLCSMYACLCSTMCVRVHVCVLCCVCIFIFVFIAHGESIAAAILPQVCPVISWGVFPAPCFSSLYPVSCCTSCWNVVCNILSRFVARKSEKNGNKKCVLPSPFPAH